MTSGRRITISIEAVRMALAEQHAQFTAMPELERLHRARESYNATPGEYAAAVAGHLFALLEKHSEKTP